MTKPNPTSPDQWSKFEETRTHILLAGRELLLAAQGVLKFCSQYVEASEKSSPNLRAFFKRAMQVADELGSGLKDFDNIKKAARSAIKPIFTTMEHEMATKKRPRTSKRGSAKKTPAKKTKHRPTKRR